VAEHAVKCDIYW